MTSPDRNVPEGAVQISSLSDLQDYTEENVRQRLEFPLRDTMSNLRDSMLDGLVGGIKDLVRGVVRPGWERHQEFADGQLALNERTDLISALLDYGSTYTEGRSWLGQRVMAFDRQVGPMRGCSIRPVTVSGNSGAGIEFHEKGVWDIRCQLTLSWVASPAQQHATVSIVVHAPDGSIFHFTRYRMPSATDNSTISFISSVVVDTPGYYVTVQVTSISAAREIHGGPEHTRLTVHHISQSVDNIIDEDSDQPTEPPEEETEEELVRSVAAGAPIPMILAPAAADDVGSRASVMAVWGEGPWPDTRNEEAA